MALESYIFTQAFSAPYVIATGNGRNPQAVKAKRFQKNEIVQGELKHSQNKPAFILVGGRLVVPLEVVKKVVAEDIKSSADGSAPKEPKKPITLANTAPKIKYIDAVVFGAILGVAGVYLAEKQGWIQVPEKKNKIYGAIIGAAAGVYLVYRYKVSQAEKPKPKTDE